MIKDILSKSQSAQLQQLMRYKSVRPSDTLDAGIAKELVKMGLARLEQGQYIADWENIKNWEANE